MPLFEYSCVCGYQFEELVKSVEDSSSKICKKCGNQASKQVSRFSASISHSTNESVDMKIGREASKRWQSYHDKQSKRHDGKEIKTLELPKAEDNRYMPIMGLGDSKEKKARTDFVGALHDHRKKRVEKGQAQFTGSGAF